jgi:hypothetical protein
VFLKEVRSENRFFCGASALKSLRTAGCHAATHSFSVGDKVIHKIFVSHSFSITYTAFRLTDLVPPV